MYNCMQYVGAHNVKYFIWCIQDLSSGIITIVISFTGVVAFTQNSRIIIGVCYDYLKCVLIYRFSANDSKGGMAPTAIITINLCNCSGNGDCLFGELADGQASGSNFRIVGCKCNTGYSGIL